jgi:hypothetical protein
MTDEDAPDGVSLLDLGTKTRSPFDDEDEEPRDPDKFTEKYEKSVVQDQVRGVVRQYGTDGISASVVADMLDISAETARRHLKELCSLREVYRQKANKQMDLYYPNGKPLHGIGSRRIEADSGDQTLEVQLAKGKNDELYFHVKEKRFSLIEGERTEGAIMFPIEHLDEFFAELNDLANEVEAE